MLIGDQTERDAAAAALLRHPAGGDLADTIDLLTLNPDMRRQVVRLLAEIDAAG